MMFKRGPLEIEFEWDHGPDLTIVFYGHRTHILSASWSAYPVLGGPALRKDYDPPNFYGPLERTVINEGLYEVTFYPPGDEGMRRIMEELPVPPPGKVLSVKALMNAIWRAAGPRSNEVQEDGGEYTA